MASVSLPEKSYFRIGEVARILDLPAHVLRFWETEFRVLRPQKSRAGQRIYNRKDVERLGLLKRLLKEERYTLEGARRYLREKGLESPPAESTPQDGAGSTPQEVAMDRAEQLRASLQGARGRLSALLVELSGVGVASGLQSGGD